MVSLLTSIILVQVLHLSLQYRQDAERKPEETPRDEVERLLREYKQNQELLRRVGSRYYQVVYPIQVRHREKMGISTREIDSGIQQKGSYGRGMNDPGTGEEPRYGPRHQKHYRQTSLLIKAFQHKFRLDLELNTRLIAPNVQKKVFLTGGATATSTSASQDVEHCYYHGVVKDWQGGEFIPGSMAALQTCNGVSGIIHLGNETFVIHPFYGGDLSSKHPHIVYHSDQKPRQLCGVSESQFRVYDNRMRREIGGTGNRTERDVRYVNQFIETALVLDKAMFDNRPGLSRRDVIHEAIQVSNIADLYFKSSLKTRLSIVYVETWEVEDQAPGISKQININKAMEDFSSYVNRQLQYIERDTTMLFTGRIYNTGETTTASVGRICTTRSVGISVDVNPFEPHILASNFAHAVGHNLGFGHDDRPSAAAIDPCSCSDWHGCIMRSTVSGEDGIQPYKFSGCSIDQFQKWMDQGSALCLLNRPSEITTGQCGNGILDDGEDCDCGSDTTCESNPCCSSYTCRLRIDAECSSGPCCDNCKMRPPGTLCRKGIGECDLDEYCTGKTGECPANIFLKNGIPCKNGHGYCFSGECPTMEDQCTLLWGHNAIPSPQECFNTYNVKGNQQGNCGQNKFKYSRNDEAETEYRKCSLSDVNCGTVHCMKGQGKPIIEGDVTHINSQSYVNKQQLECKVMSGSLGPGFQDMGLVQDGAKCGEEKICMNRTCISLGLFKDFGNCPKSSVGNGSVMECGGKGVCSNMATCICFAGWTGKDCSEKAESWQTTLIPPYKDPRDAFTFPPVEDPGPTKSHTHVLKESDSDTIMMVIVLVVGVGGIFILFAILALCYRRKSALPKYDPPYLKRPIIPGKGYSHPNSPHPSQHIPPLEQTNLDENKKMMSFTPTPTYRSVEEHGMKRMGNHGGLGSNQQLPVSVGSNQILGSGQNLMSDSSYQSEKGILKKPGPYCSMDKERWEDRMSTSSQNNLINLPGHTSLDRQELSNHPSLSRQELATHASSLSRSDLAGHSSMSRQDLTGHSTLSRSRQDLAGHSSLSRQDLAGHSSLSRQDLAGHSSLSRQDLAGHASLSRQELASHASLDRQDSRRDMSEVERTLKSLNGYHEDILEALRDAASSRAGGSRPYGTSLDETPVLTEELKRHLSESRSDGGYRGGQERKHEPAPPPEQDEMGPIRIRNLEDLIRQLEQSSNRHFSPVGSEDARISEVDNDRHFSGVNHAQGQGDPQYGPPQPGRYHPLTSSSGAGGRSPALSLVSGSGGRGSRRGSRRSPLNSPGTPLYQDNLGLSEPGVKPTQDNSDSEDYLRNKLLRSASEDGLNIPSTPEFSFDGNLESSGNQYRRQTSRMVSPTSPVSESGSSYHGSARSEQDSYTTHSERSFSRDKEQRKYFSSGQNNPDVEELIRAGYFMPEYKH